MESSRLFITGWGTIVPDCPEGLFRQTDIFQSELSKGESGTDACRIIPDYDAGAYLGKLSTRVMPRSVKNILCSTKTALDMSQADNLLNIGIVVGSTFGHMEAITSQTQERLADGGQYVSPMVFPYTMINVMAGLIGIHLIKTADAFCTTVSTGHTSGTDAIKLAENYLSAGHSQAVFVGASERSCPELESRTKSLFDKPFIEGAATLIIKNDTAIGEGNSSRAGEILNILEETFCPEPQDAIERVIKSAFAASRSRNGRIGRVYCMSGTVATDACERKVLRALQSKETTYFTSLGALYGTFGLLSIIHALTAPSFGKNIDEEQLILHSGSMKTIGVVMRARRPI